MALGKMQNRERKMAAHDLNGEDGRSGYTERSVCAQGTPCLSCLSYTVCSPCVLLLCCISYLWQTAVLSAPSKYVSKRRRPYVFSNKSWCNLTLGCLDVLCVCPCMIDVLFARQTPERHSSPLLAAVIELFQSQRDSLL